MATETMASGRKVPTRRMAFEESLQTVPRYFAADGDLLGSHITAVLSSLFPDGEDFFVRSVRHFRDRITDPELKRDVAGFIGQEATHGREHRAFNDRLGELGYPTKHFEKVVDRFLRTRERILSAKSNLAATAAAEHFTATLAEVVLTDETLREDFGTEVVAQLFIWHALEESEHKAVAFDVYRAVGGSERMRIFTMKVLRPGFMTTVAVFTLISLLRDRQAWAPRRLRDSWRRLKASSLMQREMLDRLREYDRVGFHPNDRDTDALMNEWRERLFGTEGTLNDKLVTRAA